MPFKDSRFVFIIPLKGRALARNWANVLNELRGTVQSLLAQTEGNFRAVIACDDGPEAAFPLDERFEWLKIDTAPGTAPKPSDKPFKVRALGERLRQGGADDVYCMPLDGDDLVHRDLVRYVLRGDNRSGYVMHTGYIYDYVKSCLTLVDAPDRPFNRICASSLVAYLTKDDLLAREDGEPNYFGTVTRPALAEPSARERGRPLEPFQFPAAVYRVNHEESVQFRKKGVRKIAGSHVGARMALAMFERDFSWPGGVDAMRDVLAKGQRPDKAAPAGA